MDAADRLERALYTCALTALIGAAWLALGVLSRSGSGWSTGRERSGYGSGWRGP
jgi:hypothetical protein